MSYATRQFATNVAGTNLLSLRNQYINTLTSDEGSGIEVPAGYYVTCSGYYTYEEGTNIMYFQTTLGYYARLDMDNNVDWKINGLDEKTNEQATDLLATLLNAQLRILENNLLCARYANFFSSTEKKNIAILQYNLEARNSYLQDSDVFSQMESSAPDGFKEWQPYLDKLVDSQKIGSVTISIVIGVAIIASLSTAAYYAFKYYADQAVDDLKYSDELTKKLQSQLTEDDYNQLMEETKGIVSKVAISSRLSGGLSLVKWVAIAAGSYFIYKLLSNGLD